MRLLVRLADLAAIAIYDLLTPSRSARPARVEHDEWAAGFDRMGWAGTDVYPAPPVTRLHRDATPKVPPALLG